MKNLRVVATPAKGLPVHSLVLVAIFPTHRVGHSTMAKHPSIIRVT